MRPFPATPEFLRAAKRIIWFKPPEEALASPIELLAYAMKASTDEDMALLLEHIGPDGLVEAIDNGDGERAAKLIRANLEGWAEIAEREYPHILDSVVRWDH